MPPNVLFSGPAAAWSVYEPTLRTALAAEGVTAHLSDSAPDPAAVDYIIYSPTGPVEDLAPFTRLKAILSLWAGVERILKNPTLRAPLCRMVDPGLTNSMVEWVTGHVLRYHLGIDAHITGQDGVWRNHLVPPLASGRGVTILGMGELGRACAAALVNLGFNVHGWSRRPREAPGVTTHADLTDALAAAEILVLLLPATAETENLIDAQALAALPRGARLINPGRGTLIDDAALLAALDTGQVAHATLDVFRTEPLPPADPYWAHPRVTVTPHIAADTRAETASRVIAENIRRGEAGLPFLHLVDRAAGY